MIVIQLTERLGFLWPSLIMFTADFTAVCRAGFFKHDSLAMPIHRHDSPIITKWFKKTTDLLHLLLTLDYELRKLLFLL